MSWNDDDEFEIGIDIAEVSILVGCAPDDVSDEDIERIKSKGWSVTLNGEPYCLTCGCEIKSSLENMPNRKFCGSCRYSLNGDLSND
jgi:hypothetical protein